MTGLALLCSLLVPAPHSAFAADPSPYFTYQGLLTDSGGVRLTATIDLRLGIYDPTGNCMLYREQQDGIDLSVADGTFSVRVGSPVGAVKRNHPNGTYNAYSMARVFSNDTTFTFPSVATCPGGYTPATEHGRMMRVEVRNPTITGSWVTLSPDQAVDSVPSAVVAQTLQGYQPTDFVFAGATNNITTTMIQAGAITSTTILDGTIVGGDLTNDTITATQIAPNAVTASELADNAVDTNAIANGAVTLTKLAVSPCVNGEILKVVGGVWACAADAGGTTYTASTGLTMVGSDIRVALQGITNTMISGIAANCGIGQVLKADAAGGFTCANDIGGSAGSIGATEIANNSITNVHINAAAGIVDTKLATISTAGKVSGSAITSGTIGGTTIINTSGAITGGALSGSSITSTGNGTFSGTNAILAFTGNGGSIRFKDDDTNTISVRAPVNATATYTLTLPPTAGGTGEVLTTDGAGVLSWTAVSGGSGDITDVVAGNGLTGGAATGSATLDIGAGTGITVAADTVGITPGGVTATELANNAVTSAKIQDGQVALADMANLAASTLVGRNSGGAGVPQAVTLGTGLAMSAGGVLSSTVVDTNTTYTAGTGLDLTGTTFSIPTGGVTTTEILDATITNTDINAAAAIVDTKLATITTAGKVSGSAITSGTIGGTTVINTSGAITGGAITGSSITSTGNGTFSGTNAILAFTGNGGSIRFKDDDTNTATLRAPADITTNYVLSLPVDAGGAGQVLTTSGAGGILSWSTPSTSLGVGGLNDLNQLAAGLCPPNQVLKVNGAGTAWICDSDQTGGAGTGDIDDVAAGAGLSGGGSSGPVSLSIANLGVTNAMLAANAVNSAKIQDGQVALADMANLAASTLVGRNSGGAGVPQAVTLGTGLAMSAGGVLSSTTYTAGTGLDLTGTVFSIPTGGVTTTEILDATITNTDINAAAGIVDTKLATISTAGKVSGSAITSGTIGGTTVINTSGAITGGALTGSSVTSTGNGTFSGTNAILAFTGNGGSIRFKDDDTNTISVRAPVNATATYTLTLPPTAGGTGEVLTTDGAGVLSWAPVSGGGITALTGEVTASGTGSVPATIANNAVTTAKILDGTVALADLANLGASTLIGRNSGGAGVPQAVTLGAGLAMSAGGVISNSGDTNAADDLTTASSAVGDVTGLFSNLQIGTGVVTTTEILDATITNTDIDAAAAIVDTKLATISTAGKVSGSAITSGTIGGSTVISTTGNIATTGTGTITSAGAFTASGTSTLVGNTDLRGVVSDSTGNLTFTDNVDLTGNLVVIGTGTSTIQPPSGAGAFTFRLPSSNGALGEVLQTDGAGNTSWIAVSGGSGDITDVVAGTGLTGGAAMGSATVGIAAGGVSATELANNAVTTAKILDGTVALADLANLGASTLIGRNSGGAGVPQAVTLGAGLAMSAGGVISNSGDTNAADDLTTASSAVGDVTGLFSNLQIGSGVVTTTEILDATITNTDIDAAAAIVDTKLATITSAGKVSGSAITSGTIGGTTIINTSGAITGGALSGSSITSTGNGTFSGTNAILAFTGNGGSIRFKDDDTNTISVRAPVNATATYTLTLPPTAGGTGEVLTTDGTGVLSWAPVSGGGITALTGEVTASGTGSVPATIANNAVTTAKILDGTVALADLANLGASTLIGRNSGGAGVPQAVTLGTGLTMSAGGVISSTVVDTNSGGTVTSVATGSGLTGGTITGTGTISILSDGVTATHIAANAVGSSELADNSVDSAAIVNGTIVGGDLASNITINTTGGITAAGLEVNGTLRFPNLSADGNDGRIGNSLFAQGLNIVGINNDSTARKIQIWGGITQNQNDLGNTFAGNSSFSGTVTASAYYHTSDSRLKTNVITYANALDTVSSLRGVRFNWRKNGEEEIGFIAQEVEAVDPVLVKTGSDAMKTKAVKYGNVTAILVEAVKELRAKLESTQAENEELRARLGVIEQRLDEGRSPAGK